MNLFQRANLSAAFFVLTFLVGGIALTAEDTVSVHEYLQKRPDILVMSIFIVMFRIKTLLDDHKHFGEVHQDKTLSRFIGFILAIFSWIFWGLAALSIKNTARSSEVLLYAILISSMWLFVHLSEIFDGKRMIIEAITVSLRTYWFYFNLVYIFLLCLYIGWISPPGMDWLYGNIYIMAIMNIVLIFDYCVSKPYINILG